MIELTKLLEGIDFQAKGNMKNIEIKNVCFNSKEVKRGYLFVCLKGVNTDGHEYFLEAEKNGAVAIVCEHWLDSDLPQILVENTRKTLALLSANFYGNPAKKLKLIGITGTNGKTTTTMVVRDILIQNNKKVGVIGTLGYFIDKKHYVCDLTTPDPMRLHKIFSIMLEKGVEYVAMEVSAHAIALEKIHGLEFVVGALTNITQDHLDFFKTMDNYIKTKFKFMTSPALKTSLLNADDDSVHFLENDISFTYGIVQPSDCFAMDLCLQMGRSRYILNLFDNVINIDTKLSGVFNVYNVLLGSAIACILGVDTKIIQLAISKMKPVEGRYNVINTNNGSVVIDFAHTPDGLENILKSIRQTSNAKIVTVFGCGGNRDNKKRPIMGAIAEKYSDFCFVTTDNPRFENPDLIAEDILDGMKNKDVVVVENDRKKAIMLALEKLDKNTIVAVCGKGGEKYQDINGVMSPFNDVTIVKDCLKELGFKILK